MNKIVFATLISLLCCKTSASIICTQPPSSGGGLYQSSVNGTDYDQTTWDSFRLTNAAAITEIRWRGGYLYGGAYSGTVTNWTVAIYGDIANGYQPDIINPPLESYTATGNAGETPAETIGGTALYDYNFTLPSPFQAGTNQYYWLLIQANQSGIPEWGIALGTGGNGKCFRRIAAVGDWWYYIGNGDMAFTLLTSDGPTAAIAASASPADAGQIIGAGAYPLGSLATLTARPGASYGFANWTENGTQVSASSGYQFVVSTNRTLVANFVPRYSIAVSASPNYGGSVSGGGTYSSNALVTLLAVASPGYSFVNWTEFGTPVSSSEMYSFNASANRTLVANFVSSPATATFDFDTGMPPVYPHQGLPGSQTQNGLTAYFTTLTGGWSAQNTFYGWVPGVFSGNFLYPSTWGSTLAVEFSQPVTNVSLAFFTGDVSSEYDIPTIVRIAAYTNSAMTTVVATTNAQGDWITGAYPEGTMTLNSATPFTKIKIDMPSGQGLVSYLFFADNIVAQQVVQPPATIAASAAPVGGGTISGVGTYAYNTTVTLTAVPNSGYAFSNWTEGGVEVWPSPDYTFTATTNRTLVANFVALPPTSDIVLAALPSNGGTVSGGGTFTNGEAIAVMATPNPGYDFISWTESGLIASSSANYNFIVTSNRLLVANFAAAVSPQLSIQLAGTAVILSWPTNALGFTLQQNTTLSPTNWNEVTNAISVVGTNNQVGGLPTVGSNFFRLFHF